MSLNESIIEDAALEWFGELGYGVGHGPHLAPGEPAAERESFGEVVLVGRLREAIRRLNPAIPEEAREEALRKVLRVSDTRAVVRLRGSSKTCSMHYWCQFATGVSISLVAADCEASAPRFAAGLSESC